MEITADEDVVLSLRAEHVKVGGDEIGGKSDAHIRHLRGGDLQKTRGGVTPQLQQQKTGVGVTEEAARPQQQQQEKKGEDDEVEVRISVCRGLQVTTSRGASIILDHEQRRRSSSGDGKKRVRFSVSRMGCDTNFKVTMSIKKESDGAPVFFKVK